ncbi:MAG: hypothetical protein LBC40_02625, partial [Dysgonamonadaceae bacterium]|nr:hypothetical protein [Dysgonamonadaceae bacterium]
IKDSSILKLQEENGGYMFYAAVELKTNETLTPLNYVTIEFSFTSLDAHTVWGNFDNIVLEPVNGNKYMGVFESLNDSSALLFANPSFKCEVHNYIGIGATLTVENIQTYIAGNSSSYVAAYFNNEKPTYPIVLPPAPKPDNESSGKTTVLFDKNNGQIDQLFFRDPPPNHIDYNFSIIPSTGDGFFVKGGKKYIDVIVDARLPLSFNSGTRVYSVDTLELDLTTDIDLSAGQKFALFLDYENRFCVGLDLDVQFMDENKNPIPSLAQKNTMEAADTWTNIANAKPKTGSIQFVFEGNQLNDMKKVKYVAFKSDAKTAGFGNPNSTETVNIHPDDYIKFTISAFGKFEIK